ncbi:hypothetical protein J4050_03580 [Winogradskyella sp. DF17]|jgi:hypothetical protein|uniref:Uncharacterized protein n=1 Tax=Winogradskyella pelagia TaxID=2819984 RepID=A0ABS3T256_9FLAO|nr:hypothetical protein [Winogradskyella sp. DF17]MBO3115810.1 hypothetical protein [Winogradskyella sp. DF17]
MELSVNQDLDLEPEPLVVACNITEGLLKSNYKMVVNGNFKTTSSDSIFKIRQGIKAIQSNTVNHASVILKLTLFAVTLIAIF